MQGAKSVCKLASNHLERVLNPPSNSWLPSVSHQAPLPPKSQKSGFFPSFGKITSGTQSYRSLATSPCPQKPWDSHLQLSHSQGAYLTPLLLGAQLRVGYRGYRQWSFYQNSG